MRNFSAPNAFHIPDIAFDTKSSPHIVIAGTVRTRSISELKLAQKLGLRISSPEKILFPHQPTMRFALSKMATNSAENSKNSEELTTGEKFLWSKTWTASI